MVTESAQEFTDGTHQFPFPLSPDHPQLPDDILDSLIDALRATVAHPDASFQALAAATLDQVHEIQEAAKRRLAGQRRQLTIGRLGLIIQSVEAQFRLETGTLIDRRRTQRIVMARQLAMFLCRSLTSASYPVIAEALHRDHSSVIWGADSIRCRMARDYAFRGFVQRLEREIARGIWPAMEAAA
jgi:chromosomal replication initiator protein